MMNCESEAAKICAALVCLTKRKSESYDDFISRVLPNELACRVKLADLKIQTGRQPNFRRLAVCRRDSEPLFGGD